MTKEEARQEVIRRWRELPIRSRMTHKDAAIFAEVLAGVIQFETLGDRKKMILAWLDKDLEGQAPPIPVPA